MDLSDLKYLGNFESFEAHGAPPCSETDPEAFFPQDDFLEYTHRKATYYNESGAKQICSTCPYRMACLETAMADPTLIGIWGGTTDGERRLIRRRLHYKTLANSQK